MKYCNWERETDSYLLEICHNSKKVTSTLKQPNGTRWCHFHLHILHKAAKSMAKLISQSYGELQLTVILSRGYGAI